MAIEIYHNPRCSKSRQTLALLRENGIEPDVIEYLSHPPTATELKKILKMLGMSPRELMRKKEATYKESGADNPELNNDELVSLMIQHPILIERPIVVANGKAAIGRPPENVMEIV